MVCPLSTILNWKAEFAKWLDDGECEDEIDVYELVSLKNNNERYYMTKQWARDGGVLIMGYDMFRNLSNPTNKRVSKKQRTSFYENLVDPGNYGQLALVNKQLSLLLEKCSMCDVLLTLLFIVITHVIQIRSTQSAFLKLVFMGAVVGKLAFCIFRIW